MLFADKQNKENLGKEIVLFMHKSRTETELKPWPKNRGTDRTVGYLYRSTPNTHRGMWKLVGAV